MQPAAEVPLLVIVGPTGVGKTELAVRLAELFGGEVVSADSRQIYRFMDIGTAKPDAEQRARAPHHLIDLVDPDQVLTAAEYQSLALAAINEISARGNLPILVGGTGLYVRVVTEGFEIPRVAPDEGLRTRLEAEAHSAGTAALHARLAGIDPKAAAGIDPRNVRRVVRALEVCIVTGRPVSQQQRRQGSRFRELRLGLTMERQRLFAGIDARVDAMIASGLVDEVRGLVSRGCRWDLPAMSAVGYREVGAYLRGEVTLEEAVRDLKSATHRYVRQQYNWFRLNDPRIHWLSAQPDPLSEAKSLVDEWLQEVMPG